MRLIPSFNYMHVLLGAGGGLGLTFLFSGHPGAPAADVGELPAVYAAPAERMEVRRLGSGQTLGAMLSPVLDVGEQQAAVMSLQELASPRRLATGTEITIRQRAGDGWVRGVDVALNADSTVRLTRDDFGWHSSIIVTPLGVDTVFAAGSIQQSLYSAMLDNPSLSRMPEADRLELVFALDKVFQWQIDFSRQIQPGDYYRFAVERKVRPDGSMHSEKIVAAELVNSGKRFQAIWFDAEGDGVGSYYDSQGKSLRAAFLKKPLEFRRISSVFSNGRLHPILRTWRAHRGVDYAANAGTPVYATADGTVAVRGVSGGYGNLVEIRHKMGFSTRYGHLSRFASGLRVGSPVRQGEVIGYVGMTGLATGPHLHYEMLRSGRQVDPLSAVLPTGGEPVPGQALERWTQEMVSRLALLDVLPGPDEVRYATGATVPPPPPLQETTSPAGAGGGR
jgi:murein DD-endopeptidase MepM/ murein hydrolase activator NlpD